MENIKVLSLFSGIGAPEKALKNIGVNYELVGFSEIDNNAIEAYSLIHNIDKKLNLGDIETIDKNSLSDFDLLLAGFPCTDISNNGKQKGFNDKNTSSGLVNYAIEFISHKKPKFILFENVKNLISKKFKDDFEDMISKVESNGYKCYYKLLNTKDFGLPQNRERVYMVFIRNDQNINFDFDFSKKELISLSKILEKDDCIDNIQESIKQKILSQFQDVDIIKNEINNTNKEPKDKVVCLNSKNTEGKQPSQQYRVYSKNGLLTTLSSQLNGRYNVISSLGHVRKITPREAYLLQGFGENDFDKVKHLSQNSLYSQAGNTISIPVLEEIFKKLLCDFISDNTLDLTNVEIEEAEGLGQDFFISMLREKENGQLSFDFI